MGSDRVRLVGDSEGSLLEGSVGDVLLVHRALFMCGQGNAWGTSVMLPLAE